MEYDFFFCLHVHHTKIVKALNSLSDLEQKQIKLQKPLARGNLVCMLI